MAEIWIDIHEAAKTTFYSTSRLNVLIAKKLVKSRINKNAPISPNGKHLRQIELNDLRRYIGIMKNRTYVERDTKTEQFTCWLRAHPHLWKLSQIELRAMASVDLGYPVNHSAFDRAVKTIGIKKPFLCGTVALRWLRAHPDYVYGMASKAYRKYQSEIDNPVGYDRFCHMFNAAKKELTVE